MIIHPRLYIVHCSYYYFIFPLEVSSKERVSSVCRNWFRTRAHKQLPCRPGIHTRYTLSWQLILPQEIILYNLFFLQQLDLKHVSLSFQILRQWCALLDRRTIYRRRKDKTIFLDHDYDCFRKKITRLLFGFCGRNQNNFLSLKFAALAGFLWRISLFRCFRPFSFFPLFEKFFVHLSYCT